jgi:hypothetical protein
MITRKNNQTMITWIVWVISNTVISASWVIYLVWYHLILRHDSNLNFLKSFYITIFETVLNLIISLPGLFWIGLFLDMYLKSRRRYFYNYLLLMAGGIAAALTNLVIFMLSGILSENKIDSVFEIIPLIIELFCFYLIFLSSFASKEKHNRLNLRMQNATIDDTESIKDEFHNWYMEWKLQNLLLLIFIISFLTILIVHSDFFLRFVPVDFNPGMA